MSGILRLESLTKGNTLKQGDLTLLKYRLFDADGDKLDISGKPATVRLMKNDFTFIAYEREGLTVAQDDTISFSINKILPGGLYHLEVIVDDKYIFPSRSDEGKFNVDKSSLGAELTIIENTGIDAVVRKAVDLINEDPSLIIDEDKLISEIIANTSVGSIEEYYQEYRDAIKEYADLKPKAVSAVSKSEEALTLSKSVQEQFNQVVIDGDSSVEAAQARVDASGQTNPTLKARLDKEHNEVTAQLAQTVTKDEGGVITPAMLSQETKEQMTGGSVAVVGVDSVLEENITNGAVSPKKTDFLTSDNLYDYKKRLLNTVLHTGSGNTNTSTSYDVSDYIPVSAGLTYYVSPRTRHIVFYDASKVFSSVINGGATTDYFSFVAPAEGFIRISIFKDDAENLTVAQSNTPKDIGKKMELTDDIKVRGINLVDNAVTSRNITPTAIDIEHIAGTNNINLFDKNKATLGYVSNTGVVNTSTTLYLSDYIPVIPNNVYSLPFNYSSPGAMYDENKNFLGVIPAPRRESGTEYISFQITIPPKVVYIRPNINGEHIDIFMVTPTATYPTEYTPYGADINWLKVKSKSTKSKWNGKDMVMLGDSIVWYDGNGRKGYLSWLDELIGFNSTLNRGVSGATIADRPTASGDVYDRVSTVDYANYDLVLIAAGTNDFKNGMPIGELGDMYNTTFDESTFLGAYRYIIEYILNSNPAIQIVLFTPLQRDAQSHNVDTVNVSGHKLIDYAKAVKSVAEMYSLPVIDLYGESGVNKFNLSLYTDDNLHLIDAGYEFVTVNKIAPALELI